MKKQLIFLVSSALIVGACCTKKEVTSKNVALVDNAIMQPVEYQSIFDMSLAFVNQIDPNEFSKDAFLMEIDLDELEMILNLARNKGGKVIALNGISNPHRDTSYHTFTLAALDDKGGMIGFGVTGHSGGIQRWKPRREISEVIPNGTDPIHHCDMIKSYFENTLEVPLEILSCPKSDDE